MNVAAMLLERARECPDAPALVETRRGQRLTLSFGELNARSGQAGAALRAHGVKKGSAVLLFHPPTADLYVALIGLLRIGAVAVVVEPAGGRKLLSDACNILPPAALFASPKAQLLRLMVPALRRIPVKFSSNQSILPAQLLVCDGDVPIDVADREICVDCSNDDLALVTFTSGSTGKPKGALRTHGILRAQYSALHDVTARCCNVDLVTLPIVVLSNLASGAATVLPNTELTRPRNVDAAAIAVQIESEAVTRITASPAVVERLADFALRRGTLINAVRLIVTGGGPVFPDIVARMRAAAPNSRVVSVYGSTEAEPIAHVIDSDVSAVDVSAM